MAFLRSALFVSLGIGAIALSACGDAASKLSDAELRSLLRSDSASPATINPPIDRTAVECLSAWSGDRDLIRTLPPGIDSTAVKANCRQRVEGWLADTGRNPHRLTFDDIATEAVARRALALLDQPAPPPATSDTVATHPPTAKPMVVSAAATKERTARDEQAFNGALAEYESLCQQAQRIASKAKTPSMDLGQRINACLQRSGQMRAQMDAASAKGNPFETSMIAQNAQRVVAGARRLVEDATEAAQ